MNALHRKVIWRWIVASARINVSLVLTLTGST